MFNHQGMETYLGRYAGLLLYLKEMDETLYSKFCAVRDLGRVFPILIHCLLGVLFSSQRPSQHPDERSVLDLFWPVEEGSRGRHGAK